MQDTGSPEGVDVIAAPGILKPDRPVSGEIPRRTRITSKASPLADTKKKASPEGLAYESLYRRGCLKGTLYVHCTQLLCKCEMKNRDCSLCNRPV